MISYLGGQDRLHELRTDLTDIDSNTANDFA